MLKKLNKLIRKFNTYVGIPINRLNALNEARKGNFRSIKMIFRNKFKNKVYYYLKRLF